MSAPRRLYIVVDRDGHLIGIDSSMADAKQTKVDLRAMGIDAPFFIEGPYERRARRRARRRP